MEGIYRNIFTYEDRFQDTPTKDGQFYNCTFLIDYGNYKKGDKVEIIDFDWQDHTLSIEGKLLQSPSILQRVTNFF